MNNENWVKWEPISDLYEKYDLISFDYNINGLKITLLDEIKKESKIQLKFKNSIDSCRVTYENNREKIFFALKDKYGSSFYLKWTFFKVHNSEYLKWLSDESYTVTDYFNLTHFCIISSESIIDIIASYEPEVKYVKLKRT